MVASVASTASLRDPRRQLDDDRLAGRVVANERHDVFDRVDLVLVDALDDVADAHAGELGRPAGVDGRDRRARGRVDPVDAERAVPSRIPAIGGRRRSTSAVSIGTA